MPDRRARAMPTSRRNIEPRWFPPPARAVPRCCESRPHKVLLLPAFSACVPTRTTRKPASERDLVSPWFQEEVEPAPGPAHAAGAFGEETSSADSSFQPVHQLIESLRVGEPVSHGDGR